MKSREEERVKNYTHSVTEAVFEGRKYRKWRYPFGHLDILSKINISKTNINMIVVVCALSREFDVYF